MVTIKRIDVGSAGRVGAIISLIIGAISGLLFIALPSLLFGSLASIATVTFDGSTTVQRASGMDAFAAIGLVGMCVFYVSYVVLSAIFGGIAAIIGAFAYNLTSGWVGGLQVDLDDGDHFYDRKAKRRAVEDSIYE